MNHFLHGVVRAIAETFELPEPILEIGARQVHGQEDIADVRTLLPGKEFMGLDMQAGAGVDYVGNVESLPHLDASVGTVLALNTFEHVRHFWRGFDEIRRVLRPDGVVIVTCPFFFRIHEYPADYWRFTPAALEMLLEDYPSKIIGWHGARNRPANVWGMAQGPARPPITPEQLLQYRSLLSRHVDERRPSPWRRFRFALAGLVCGRVPFAPYLDHHRWETVCRTNYVSAPSAAPPARSQAAASTSA